MLGRLWQEVRSSLKALPDSIRLGSLGGSLKNPGNNFIDLFGGAGGLKTEAGIYVDEYKAMNFSAVYRCVGLISGTVAAMPVRVGRIKEDTISPVYDHQLDYLLNVAPNDESTPFSVKETWIIYALLWGTGYLEIVRNPATLEPEALFPLESWRVSPMRDASERLYYEVVDTQGMNPRKLDSYYIMALPNLGFNGVEGLSTISAARNALGLGLAAESYGATFFGNGQIPAGVIESPTTLDEVTRRNMRTSWAEMHRGTRKRSEIAIMEGGAVFKRLSVPPEDAQFLQTREFQVVDIARWFGVPPYMIGVMRGAGSIDVGKMGDEFKTLTLTPWTTRVAQEARRKLIPYKQRRTTTVWLDAGKVLRGGIEQRIRTHSIAIQSGMRTINECRIEEGWEPIDEESADNPLIPVNLSAGGTPAAGGQMNEPKGPEKEEKPTTGTSQDDPTARVGGPEE